MASRTALLIGNSTFSDPQLRMLAKPSADVRSLSRVLSDPQMGTFNTTQVLENVSRARFEEAVWGFFQASTKSDDLLLMYFSGHGVRDEHGDLYLATSDTKLNFLPGTAVHAEFVKKAMDSSRSRRQILVLDCCHSGAFPSGYKSSVGASFRTAEAFGSGYGRIILTASDALQYAFESDGVHGSAEASIFTQALIDGIVSGDADSDCDFAITIDEWYDYAFQRVTAITQKQRPQRFGKQEERLMIAGVAANVSLSRHIDNALRSESPSIKLNLIQRLAVLAKSEGTLPPSFDGALKLLLRDDSQKVRSAAMEVLNQIQRNSGKPAPNRGTTFVSESASSTTVHVPRSVASIPFISGRRSFHQLAKLFFRPVSVIALVVLALALALTQYSPTAEPPNLSTSQHAELNDAKALYLRGNPDGAFSAYRDILKRDPMNGKAQSGLRESANAILRKAQQAHDLGHYDYSIAKCNVVLESLPQNADALKLRERSISAMKAEQSLKR